jgi:hypothetical protein
MSNIPILQFDDTHPGGDQEEKYYYDLLGMDSGPEEMQGGFKESVSNEFSDTAPF